MDRQIERHFPTFLKKHLSDYLCKDVNFSPPCENTLLVPCHPPRLLLGHEVCKVPNHLPDEPALRLCIVERPEVLLHEVVLELLREADRGEGVEAGHGVRPVLGHQDGLAVRLPPVAQVAQHLSVDQLQVAVVSVP